jgi:hypothetical protein
MEEQNQTYLKSQDELKTLRLKCDSELKARDQFIQQLLERSSLLKQKLMKQKGRDCLNELELSVAKLMELKPPCQVSIELRDHILDLY